MPVNRLLLILAAVILAAGLTVALFVFLPAGMKVWLVPALLAVGLAVRYLIRGR